MLKRPRSRCFDDLTVGERRSSPAGDLTEDDIVAFARQFDPQPFHTERSSARSSAFGGLIASGMHLLAIARRLDDEMNGDIAFICGLAFEEVRFRRPGRPGDKLFLSSEIVALRPSAKEARGIVTHDFRLANQRDETVLTFRAASLVERRAISKAG